ncbi:AAA family ATPase [Aureimonas sp. Leaf427]|uniref:AAA family ATPase n=1 Tax=Aureimonas sp. Leaf427 TaxID=1736375 RepID=UPI0006F7F505|nr:MULTISPECIES: AAA family ATPase [unclassified Aureimonas]KQT69747.1 hypothetical protein ASG62_01105 [Aureimonas sp. Leaf427]KQT76101.1 hypothetical protein ASG54_15115 [Aureimonas sp. Leaf460]
MRPAAYCTIFAGPNGSGKSTLYPALDPVGEFVNADVVARQIAPHDPAGASMNAGRLVLAKIDNALNQKRSFVYETTLSSRQSIAVMERCRSLGYEIALVYVTLRSPDLNVQRVAERVARGGHHIEEAVIRRRYETAFSRLPSALALADTALIFDNSDIGAVLLLAVEKGHIASKHLDRDTPLHLRLAHAAADALQTDVEAFF